MTVHGNGSPQDPAEQAARTREDLGRAAETTAAKVDDLKGHIQETTAEAKDTVAGQTDQAVQAAEEKVTQVKGKASDLASRMRDKDASTPTMSPAVRGAGATALGLGAALVAWLLRRRARQNTNPWNMAVRNAKSQVKTARRHAKSGLKTTGKRSRAGAAATKSKARNVKAKARPWG
jgi:hypothetical protein